MVNFFWLELMRRTLISPLKSGSITPSPTSMWCFDARPLLGARFPCRPGGIDMNKPLEMAFQELGGMEVSAIACIS
eukprot:6397943-Ditylum_brightwellii.AAC.1